MKWQRSTSFITTVILSLLYISVFALNLFKFSDPKNLIYPTNTFYPIYSLIYLVAALLISWSLYAFGRSRPTENGFILDIVVGVFLIFIGVFLWK